MGKADSTGSLKVIQPGAAGSVPLFILAGFPYEVGAFVRTAIERSGDLRPAKYITSAFPADQSFYRRDGEAANTLLQNAGRFAIREIKKSREISEIAPSKIFLLYVANFDSERLLEHFDFFVFPVPITGDRISADGRHWRHDGKAAFELVHATIKGINTDKWRDQSLARAIDAATRTALVLPPNNYLMASNNGTKLSERLRQIRSTIETYPSLDEEEKPTRISPGKYPDFMRGKGVSVYLDSRGLAFPYASSDELHGLIRQLPPEANVGEIRHVLNQLYRFGMPIRVGFHYDAQFCDGRSIPEGTLTCSKRGVILKKLRYANIYPNDFIRVVD